MKKYYYLIVLALILGLVLTGCSLLSNISQVPTTGQSGITYLTKGVPLPVNLVGLWHLDEGSGITAFDSSGNTNDGTLMGNTIWTSGKFGDALIFDGDGDYVHLPASNTILNTNIFTIEAWFKTSVNHPVYGSPDGIGEGRIVNLARDAAGYTAVALYVEHDNIAICYHNGAKFKYLMYAVDYYDDTWHHIAVTRDSTTYRIYYDGAEVASRADTFVGFGTSAAYLGTFYPVTTIDPIKRFFNGTIDEVCIWDGALTAEQIADSANHGIVIQKRMSKDDVFLGDTVTITLEVVTAPAPVTITDTLPSELHYIPGTFKVGGTTPTTPPVVVGQEISYTLAGACSYTITFDAQVTSVEATILEAVTNTANATVEGEEDGASASAELTIHPYEGFKKEVKIEYGDTVGGVVEVGELVQWDMTITVPNNFDWKITNATLSDRLGAELGMAGDRVDNNLDELGEIDEGVSGDLEESYNDIPGGAALIIKTKGKANKVQFKITGIDISSGSDELFVLGIFTDKNPAGKQCYTSDGIYELNSGAVLKFTDPETDFQLSAHTLPIALTVGQE